MKNINSLVRILGEIKNLRRSGWIKREVSNPESDADHMYSMAIEVLLLAPPHLNKCHCLELALTHDLPEIYSTDILPGQMEPDKKFQLELAAAQKITEELDFPQLVDWFLEYENQSTPEARFVKCLDKMDNVLTASYYEQERRNGQPLLKEFAPNACRNLEKIDCPEREICLKIIQQIENDTD